MALSRESVSDLIELFDFEVRKLERSLSALRSFNFFLSANPQQLRALQAQGLFWNVVTDSLRDSSVITLGRIMDKDDRSLSARVFLSQLEKNIDQFDREHLVERKVAGGLPREHAEAYAATAFIPTTDNVARLNSHLDSITKFWETNLKDIRHKQVAHRDISTLETPRSPADDPEDQGLINMVSTLVRIATTTWEWYQNGRETDFDTLPGMRESGYVEKDVSAVLEMVRLGAIETGQIGRDTRQ